MSKSLRGRRLSRALLESPSTKHAKNVTRTNHSERLARQKLKDCIYKQKMNTHIYSLSSCFWFGFSALLILIKAFTKEVPLCSTSNQLIKVESRTTQAKCGLYTLRTLSTLLVLALLGGAIYAIVFAVAISTDPVSTLTNIRLPQNDTILSLIGD